MSRGTIGQPSRQKATKRVLPLVQAAFNIKTRATAEAWGKKGHSYRPLPTRFRRDGFDYRQIARDEDVAIYEQTCNGCSDPSVCYELVASVDAKVFKSMADLSNRQRSTQPHELGAWTVSRLPIKTQHSQNSANLYEVQRRFGC